MEEENNQKGNSDDFISKNNTINFIYNQNENNEFVSSLKRYTPTKKYLISKEDFDKLNKFNSTTDFNKIQNGNNGQNLDINNITFYSKLEDLKNNSESKIELSLVNEEFLNPKPLDIHSYENKYIYLYEIGNKYFLYFNDNEILEIPKPTNNREQRKNEDMIPEESSVIKEENILEQMILIYANENNFDKSLNSKIKDEYNTKKFYLINKIWIENYKNQNYFKEIKKIIEKLDIDYSYKGFCLNLKDIVKNENLIKIKNKIKPIKNKDDFFREKNFYPNTYEDEFKKINNIKNNFCPKNFTLVPKNLFKLLYKEIVKSNEHSIDDYKYNTLIGDNALFIQDKTTKSIFYYFNPDKNLALDYIFIFNEEISFYNEIALNIIGKDFAKYINKKIKKNSTQMVNELKDNNKKVIGKFIIFSKLKENEIKRNKIKNKLEKYETYYSYYNQFKSKFSTIKDNNISENDFNDIFNIFKKNNIQNLKVGIILSEDFNYLWNILYFTQIENLFNNKKKHNYKDIEEDIINELLNNDSEDIKDFVNDNLELYDSRDFGKNKNKNKIYRLTDIEFLKMIMDSSHEIIEYLEKIQDSYFFKNNDKHYIIFPNDKKLYKVEYHNNTESFKLKEYIFKLEDKNSLNNLERFYDNECKIKEELESPIYSISDPKEFYIVNYHWIKKYKVENKNKNVNSKKKIISDYLKDNQNLIPNMTDDEYTNFKAPLDFELIEINILNSIFQDINEKYKIKLYSEYIYQVSFGNNKVFIQNDSNKNSYFIYSIKDRKYIFEYFIKFQKNFNIKKFLSLSEYEQELEDYLEEYGIDLSDGEEQMIINDNLKLIGNIKIINPTKKRKAIKDPKHCLGLENIGATCYMNATIQCLCHVLNIKTYFQSRQLIYDDIYNKNCPLTIEFYKLLNNLWKEPVNNKKYYTPTDFKNLISELNPLFKGIAANDSKDLIIFIYETIHNEINKKNNYLN